MTGTGTIDDPFIITSKTDLQAMEDNLGSYYELGSDIDASGTGEGFDPIILFTGQLDGKGFTITGLFINRPTEFNVGLIGYTNASIVLKNITMTGVNITGNGTIGALLGNDNGGGTPDIDNCNSAGSVTGSNGQVGGLIGLIKGGAVDDCWSSCTVIGGAAGSQTGGLIGYCVSAIITQCYATGAVSATGANGEVGGLIGELWDGTVQRCYATGNATAVNYAGGLIGYINSAATVTNCYARGDAAVDAGSGSYAGGLTGDNDEATIDDCYSTGAATGSAIVGGLIGEDNGTVTNCFWDTETSGNATSDGGTGKTTAQMKAKATFTDAGWNFTTPIWAIDGTTNNGYPFLGGGSIYPTDPLLRASGIKRSFWAGIGGQAVYQVELALGGMSTTYVSPIGSRDPASAVTPTPLPTGPGYQYSDYQAWLNTFASPLPLIRFFGKMPSYEDWLKWKASQLEIT